MSFKIVLQLEMLKDVAAIFLCHFRIEANVGDKLGQVEELPNEVIMIAMNSIELAVHVANESFSASPDRLVWVLRCRRRGSLRFARKLR